MKTTSLIIVFLLGGILGFVSAKYVTSNKIKEEKAYSSQNRIPEWSWNDSLDAVKMAPKSHKIVYEDDKVRVLQVVLHPNSIEPIHTHQFKSIMWFAKETSMTYFQYESSKNGQYKIIDSIKIAKIPIEALNHGDIVDPETPHAVKNTGKEIGIAYRIELKKVF